MVCVGGPSYNQTIGKVDIVENIEVTVERLAGLMIAEWSDSQADSSGAWRESHEALKLAKDSAGEELIAQAYELAKKRWSGLVK